MSLFPAVIESHLPTIPLSEKSSSKRNLQLGDEEENASDTKIVIDGLPKSTEKFPHRLLKTGLQS